MGIEEFTILNNREIFLVRILEKTTKNPFFPPKILLYIPLLFNIPPQKQYLDSAIVLRILIKMYSH